MGRILAIDYGRKRCGIAVTDILQIVANALTSVPTSGLIDFLKKYCEAEPVEKIIIGYPRRMDGVESDSMQYIRPAIKKIESALPEKPIYLFDERFTSTLAHRSMIEGGMKKMQRRDKSLVDPIAASIILNDYLESIKYNLK